MKTMISTWKVIFKDWNNFKVYSVEETFQKNKASLNDLLSSQIEIKSLKKCKSHQILLIKFLNQNRFNFVLKAFFTRLLKRNRAKHYLDIIRILDKLEIPVVKPLLIFWKNPMKAFLRGENFYGGVLFPYIEEGFVVETMFFKNHEKENLDQFFIRNLLKFICEVHQKGVLIRDTKYNNFFYHETQGFKLFDLDGVKFLGRPLKKFERIKDIVSLAITLNQQKIVSYEQIFKLYKEVYKDLEDEDYEMFTYFIKRKSKNKE